MAAIDESNEIRQTWPLPDGGWVTLEIRTAAPLSSGVWEQVGNTAEQAARLAAETEASEPAVSSDGDDALGDKAGHD